MVSSPNSTKNGFRSTAPYIMLGGCIIAIGLIYTLTLREGHDWGGDYALYIAHAKNIVSGHPYGATGYIPNPDNPDLSPVVYPPIFPVLLSPSYKMFGMNLYVMKITVIVIMMCMLSIWYLYVKQLFRNLVTPYLCILAVGLSPWLWDMRDQVYSEIPFMMFLFLSLLLAEAAIIPGQSEQIRNRFLLGCAAGISTYLAYGTRTVGGILIPAYLLFDLLNQKKISASSVTIVITFTILATVQYQILHSEEAYAGIVNMYTWDVFHRNALEYSRNMVAYWRSSSFGLTGAHYIFYATAPLFFLGWLTSLVRGLSIGSIFFAMYILLLIALPIYGGARYLLPIIPFYILYIFMGSEVLGDWLRGKMNLLLPILVSGVIMVAYASWYKDQDLSAVSDGPYTRASLDLFAFVKEHTNPDSIFIFRKPRILALYTKRKASPPPLPNLEDTLWTHINKISATHIIMKHAGKQLKDTETLFEWVDKNRARLELLFENEEFRVYKININKV